MNMTAKEQRKIGSTCGKAILIGALVLSMGGGSAYAGTKIGAKKLKTVTVRTSSISIAANNFGLTSVKCEDGERALSLEHQLRHRHHQLPAVG
jgi:hypothetical protein